jgi:outer membrane protein assembly factor BamB
MPNPKRERRKQVPTNQKTAHSSLLRANRINAKRLAAATIILAPLVLSLALSIAYAESSPSTDWWSTSRHDATHTGYSTSKGSATNQSIWNYETAGMILFNPVVIDDLLYVGSYDQNFYCLNASDGNLKWKIETGTIGSETATVINNKVYFGLDNGSICCLDASEGSLQWKYDTGGPVLSSPTVVNGRVYVGSRDFSIYCLDAASGNLLWTYATNNYVHSTPAVADGKVYVGCQDHNVYCLGASDGNLIWNYTTGDVVYSSPAVTNGRVYVGSVDNMIYCLDSSNGNLMWQYATDGHVFSSPAVADGRVYVGSNDYNVYCLDSSNGNLMWKYATNGEVFSSPAVADGKVYVGSRDSNVYCLLSSNGELVWKYTTGDYIVSSPAVANGKVYIGSSDGKVYAFSETETATPTFSATPATFTPKPLVTPIAPTIASPNASTTQSPTLLPSQSLTVAEIVNVPWVPPPENAAVATTLTVVAISSVSAVVAAAANPVGSPLGKVAEKAGDLLPETIKKWLTEYMSSKRRPSLEQKKHSAFAITKAEALAYFVSMTVLTISFSYVKVPNFTQMFVVLPTILATAVIVEFVKTFATVAFARSLGVWAEHRLWFFGLAMFIVTTFALGIPFSSPSRNLYHAPKLSKRREGIAYAAGILVTLAFAALFFVLLLSGFTLVGSTGLAMCAIMAFLDAFPVSPMNGKAVYDYSRAAWGTLFVGTLAVYLSWLIFL